MPYILFGLGNPLLDMSAVVDEAYLKKYKLEPNGAILAEPEHKQIFEELPKLFKVDYVAGGAAQNAMRGAQWLLPKGSTVYVGATGKDREMQILKEAAAKDGLHTEYYEADAPTGRCAVLINGIHRSLVTDLQAAEKYTFDHLDSDYIWRIVESAKFFYVGGYFLTSSPESALALGKHAARANKTFALNLSATFIPKFFLQHLEPLIAYCDILFGNEEEAIAYAESRKLETRKVSEIALFLSALIKKNVDRKRIVVITQGAGNTIVATDGRIEEYPIIPIETSKIVDTNGCGDAYCGGFMSQFVQNQPIEICCAAGAYVAHTVIQRLGPTYPKEPHTFVQKAL